MRKIAYLSLVLACSTTLHAQCGVDKPFKILVQKSSHKDRVEVPTSGCRTSEGPCKASGTVFIVLSKKVKYTTFLVDGTSGNLQVGETYTVFLSCSANPMMTVNDSEGHATATLYVIDQEAASKPHSPS
jgi:hypothetical protein